MRRFYLVREVDESGVSGTGVVAEGMEFTSGRCVIKWLTATSSMGVYESAKDLKAIHGHGGNTKIKWIDKEEFSDHELSDEENTPGA